MSGVSSKAMNEILVVNVNWLGDVIFSSPVFRALKTAYPDARIRCLAVPRVRDLLECVPFIDEVIVYDEDGRHKGPFGKAGLIYQLRRRRFDAAFLLHKSLTRALLVYWAGIPRRIGYDTKKRGKLLTHAVPYPDETTMHRSDYYLNIVESFGVRPAGRETELRVDQAAKEGINRMLEEHAIGDGDFVIALNPGGNWDLKRWPGENFVKLLTRLCAGSYPEVKIVLIGAQSDAGLTGDMIASIPRRNGRVVDWAGKMGLKHLVALMARANLVVSADSGPLHIANSVGTDTIGLFGPTRPEVTGPRGRGRSFILQRDVGCNRSACYYVQCPDNSCMQAVHVEDVVDAIRQIKHP
jgi:lipopolysaccharide heptosyltransferase II